MMSAVEQDFTQRCDEIEQYVEYLAELESQTGLDVTLMATMKASALLMIYNLVESTASNSIESIYDHLKTSGLQFVAIDDQLKVMVLKCARQSNPKKLVDRMRSEAVDFAVASFKKDAVFSGNVDAQKIRDMWDEYGVDRSNEYGEAVLLEIKAARNDLAHGAKSFAELGRSLSVAELKEKHEKTKTLLLTALKDVKTYIGSKLSGTAA